jgi:aerobic carbon-monoxide dehydrogenase medium subunit
VKAAAFEYLRPESLAEALELMARYGDDCKPLAGGQSLVPLLAMRLARPRIVMGLERVRELRDITLGGGAVRIGAMIRQHELEHNPAVPALVRAAIPMIGHFQIRSRGTVGGSLAHMDPAAEWPALALAQAATVVVASRRGRREIPAHELAAGPLMTTLEPDELLVEVILATGEPPGKIKEVARRPGDFALVGAAAQGGRIAVFGAGPVPQRLPKCERHLAEGGGRGAELMALARAEIVARDDVHASAAYRRQAGARLVDVVVGP